MTEYIVLFRNNKALTYLDTVEADNASGAVEVVAEGWDNWQSDAEGDVVVFASDDAIEFTAEEAREMDRMD